MKKHSLVFYAAIASAIFCSFTGASFAQVVASPNPQAAAPAPVQNAVPKKTNVAVINLKSSSGVATGEAELISDRLRGELFNTGKINVMERDQMQEILKEQGFQQSGACSNEACMVEIGQLLGVEQLVSGSLGKVGSMFLVNLRIIDVKTAKIIKVVSEDVKGDIEDVVSRLPGIAAKLVSDAATLPAPIVIEEKRKGDKKADEKKVDENKKEEPKEQGKVEQPKEEEKKVEIETSDEKIEKNKNRAGVRVAFNIFGNGLYAKQIFDSYDLYGLKTGSTSYTYKDSGITKISAFINPQVKFIIKAGPFITIDIGPSYTYGSIERNYSYADPANGSSEIITYGNYINVLGFAFGVNYVKRWYPIKLNVGLMVDGNYLFNMESSTTTYSSLYTSNVTDDTAAVHNSFNISYGVRAGVEIMAGKHVGFNVDFIGRYSEFTTIEDQTINSDGTYYKDYFQYILPIFGVSFGVNFYY